MNDEKTPIEVFQIALNNMALIQQKYASLALILAEIILVAEENHDDDAEIGIRVRRILEDYGRSAR